MKTVYLVIDTVAVGSREIDDKQSLLEAVREVYPNVIEAREHERGSNVIIATTKK